MTRSEPGSQFVALSSKYHIPVFCAGADEQAVSSALGMVARIRVRHWQHPRVVTMVLLLGGKSAIVGGETRALLSSVLIQV